MPFVILYSILEIAKNFFNEKISPHVTKVALREIESLKTNRGYLWWNQKK